MTDLRRLAPALLALAFLGSKCDSPASPAEGKPAPLAPGQSTRVGDLTLTFVSVTSDSRCPTDVNCVWEGDAAVSVSLETPRETRASRELHTADPGARETTFAGYRVRLEALTPIPRSDQSIPPADYRASFLITR
jgi:hypothetical protein